MMESEMKINIADRKRWVIKYPKEVPISGYSELIPGDQIAVKREPTDLDIFDYTHHGIYVGDGKLVDFGIDSVDPDNMSIVFECRVSLRNYDEFHGPDPVVKVEHVEHKALPNDEVVERSKKLVGIVRTYNLLFYNCEDFANQMKIGRAMCYQMRKWFKRAVNLFNLIRKLLSADVAARYQKILDENDKELQELEEKYGDAIQVYCHVLNPDFDKDEAMIAMADQVDPQGRSIDFVHDWFKRFEEYLAAKNSTQQQQTK